MAEDLKQLKDEIEKLKLEIERLKSENEECEKEKYDEKLSKEKMVEILNETEKIVKKTFSILEGTLIGAIEGLKKNIKK